MRILMVIGTRPEAIKMLPLALEMRKREEFELLICHSGQHEKVAREVFEFFEVEPDFSFSAMKQGQSLCGLSVRLLNYFDVLLSELDVDTVLVHGDTTSAFCASLAAFYLGIDVAHVEAGLRTFDPRSPFPEEMNRVAIDSMSSLCFAPTSLAAENLRKEGKKSVFTVGNTVIDALKYTVRESYSSDILRASEGKKRILITMHRRESVGEKMRSALLGIGEIFENRDDLFGILPAHPNPALRAVIEEALGHIKNIKICDPLPVYDFHNLLARSFAVMTDSGGVQEEAAYLGVPVFLLREMTERPEVISGGNTVLLGTGRLAIVEGFLSYLKSGEALAKMRVRSLAFGDGDASKKIVEKLLSLR